MRRPTLDDIPELVLPDGIELRAVRPADHRAIFDAEFEAFQDHWKPDDYDETHFGTLFTKTDLHTDLWVVAWAGDEVAGVVQNWIRVDENADGSAWSEAGSSTSASAAHGGVAGSPAR